MAEDPASERLLIYHELASWWPLLSAPEEYAEEAGYYVRVLKEHLGRVPRTLLELGSGGGSNASHMKRELGALTLVDRSPAMLEVSRALNPDCEHLVGDMRDVRLDRRFDCVFVHDAICYATTAADLGAVMETAYAHCEPGGAALFAPDFVRESFEPSTQTGGYDDAEGRGLRFLEWSWDPDPSDTTYCVEYALLLREPDGRVSARHDRHLEGLFEAQLWADTLRGVGFAPHVLWHRHPDETIDRVVFVGTR